MVKKYLFRFYLFAVIAFFTQFPLFVDQYTLRLESRLQESNRAIAALEKIAQELHKSLPEYISKFLDSQDPDFHSQGVYMKGLQERNAFLHDSLAQLSSSRAIVRPFFLCVYGDHEIMRETVSGFHFGFLWSEVMLAWALIGALVGASFPCMASYIWKRYRTNKSQRISSTSGKCESKEMTPVHKVITD